MRELKQIAFLLDDFAAPSPAQQLLDRFLIGFPHQGVFQRPGARVALWTSKEMTASTIQQRRDDFGLLIAADPADALRQADAIVVAGPDIGLQPTDSLLRLALQLAPPRTPLFVHGLLASTPSLAAELAESARRRDCPLLSGTALPYAFRLPHVEVSKGSRLREGLIVVQGEFPAAELAGLEGLLPLLEQRKGGEPGVRRLRHVEGQELWRAGDQGAWSRSLLAAAISRSHTPQGNPVLDGRTEDLVGLGLVPKLARDPRGWLLEHADGLRSAVLVLNGVVADVNFAILPKSGSIISAQLFQPPLPQQAHYSRLTAALMEFFASGREPWPLRRSLHELEVMAAISSPEARSGQWMNL